MHFFKRFIIFLSLYMSCLAFGEKTLIACTSLAPAHFDPSLATDTETMDAAAFSIFDRLMMVEYGNDRISSSLAKKWRLSEDLKSFTIELRDDVSFHSSKIFHPTRNLNADDVIYSFERQFDPNHPWHNIFEEKYVYFKAAGIDKEISKIEKLDDYTVQFHLNEVNAPFIAKLTMGFLSIHSKEYMEQLIAQDDTEKLKTHPIGTGPWIFDSYDREKQKITYLANRDYFLGKPNIDRLVVEIITDDKERRQKLESGLCHHISKPTSDDLKILRSNDEYELVRHAGYNTYYLVLNTINAPLNDKNVRKALAMAIDKRYLTKEIFGDMAIVAKNLVPPKIWSYNSNIIDYPYDPKQSKKLITEAGYADGFKLQYLMKESNLESMAKVFEIIQKSWSEIGVELEILEMPADELLSMREAGVQNDVTFLGWGMDINDPDNILYNLLSCSSAGVLNSSNWCHDKFDLIVTKAKQVLDYESRENLYQLAQEIFHEELPFIPLFHTTSIEIISKKLKNYQRKGFGNQKFPPYILELED